MTQASQTHSNSHPNSQASQQDTFAPRFTYRLYQDTSWQTLSQWQPPDTPFMSFAFWQALTDSGAIGAEAGWLPIYIVIYDDNADDDTTTADTTKDTAKIDTPIADTDSTLDSRITPLAVMPVFVKDHHQGEFVFDYQWAQAYARYGLDYYPRLVTSAPYSPVTGDRVWLAKDIPLSTDIMQAALQGLDAIAHSAAASSWHGLFVSDEMAAQSEQSAILDGTPLLERQGCQFIWHNQHLAEGGRAFTNFDDFLSTLTAKKRKTIRQERKKIDKQGLQCQIKCGDEITEADWDVFYQCYAMTYHIRGQQPYLSPEFFIQLGKTMPENLMMTQALDSVSEHEHDNEREDGNEPQKHVVACSLFLYDGDSNTQLTDVPSKPRTLYGRYWGSLAEYDSLHFELCYYQGIEFAISQGIERFDPGTQGEHKLIRGFVPSRTRSLHRVYEQGFVQALAHFCQEEREYMAGYRRAAHDALPFNQDNMPDFQG